MVTKIKFSDFRSIIKCPCAPPFCGYCEPLSSSFQPHRFPLKSPTGRGFSPFPFLPSAGRRATAIQFYLLVHIDIFYYGRGLGHTFGVRVDGTSSRRLWPPDGGRLCTRVVSPQGETTHYILCVAPLLQNVFAVHRFAQGATGFIIPPPSPSFRPKRSGVEKSHSTMVQEALGREISRLRVSWERFPSVFYSSMYLRSR